MMEEYLATATELLKGAVETHVHTAPDIFDRRVDDIDAANQAKAAGMKALVIKCHVSETGSRATIATKVTGFPVFGGIALNYAVGGLNHYAVDAAAKLGAKFVWMPTFNAIQYLKHVEAVPMFAKVLPKGMKGLSVLDEDGKLKPEMKPILEIIAREDLILCTGHIAKREAEVLVDLAREMGVERIVITHATADFLDYEMDDMRRMAAKGAWIELNWVYATKQSRHPCSPSVYVEAIRGIGPNHIYFGTDGGQTINPPPVEMLRDFIANMLRLGIAEDELRLMTAANPSRLLNI